MEVRTHSRLGGRLILACVLLAGCAQSGRHRPFAEHPAPKLDSTPKTDVAQGTDPQPKKAPEPKKEIQQVQAVTESTEPQKAIQPPPFQALDPSEAKVESQPSEESDGDGEFAKIQSIVRRAVDFYASVDKYTCRVTRQERIGRRTMPMEVMEMNFRRQPRSVYYKWLNEENAGRECVYQEGANDGNVVTRGGKSDFLMVGRCMSVDPNGLLARSKSRYSITESGLDNMMGRLQKVVDEIKADPQSGWELHYHGTTRREEHPATVHHVEQTIPQGADPLFPQGGVRHWYFQPESGQLVLMEAFGAENERLEYYWFDKFFENELIDDSNFTPEVLWPKAAGKSGT